MNPKTQTYNQMKMNEKELAMGLAGTKNSWHQEYRDSAWCFLGGLPYEMSEGDVICMFSQYGEIVHINLIRWGGWADIGNWLEFTFVSITKNSVSVALWQCQYNSVSVALGLSVPQYDSVNVTV